MSENTIDIKTISNQLNYLKDTKSQLKQAMIDKGLQVDDTTPFRDYVSQISNMENVMIFDTLEEMNNTTGVADGTLCIVYKNGGHTVTASEKFKGPIYIPSRFDAGMTIDELTQKLGWWTLTAVSNYRYGTTGSFSIVDDDGNTVVSGSVYCRSWNIVNKQWKYEYTWTFYTNNGTVKYVADTTDNLAETSLFKMSPAIEDAYFCAGGSEDKEYHFVLNVNNHTSNIKVTTSSLVAMFFKVGAMTFDGVFRYNAEASCWEPAPTDLVPIDGDVYKGKYMGFDGVSEGTMSVPKYYNNDTIEDMGVQYSKFMNLITSLDTTNITDFSNFYNKLPANSKYLPFVTVSNNATNCSNMFRNATNIANMSLNHWDMSNVVNGAYMFANATFMGGNQNTYNWNLSSLVNGHRMFNGAGITSMYMSGGENIKDMSYMFATSRASFGSYGLNRFKTNSATNMVGTFYQYGGNRANVCNWNVDNVTNMSHMFYNSRSLSMFTYTSAGDTYDMKLNWTAPNCLNTVNMFCNCINLKSIGLNSASVVKFTPKSQNTVNMFANCYNLFGFSGGTNVSIDISNTLNAYQMFYNCANWSARTISGNLSNCTNTVNMFAFCKQVSNNCLNRITFNLSNCTNMAYMFLNCENLTSQPAINWNMPKMTNLYCAFNYAGMPNLNIINANIPLITNLMQLVGGARPENILIKNGYFPNITNTSLAMYYTKSITIDNVHFGAMTINNGLSWQSLDFLTTYKLLNMNLEGYTNLSGMFNNCQNLTTIVLPSNFTFANVADMSLMFTNCRSLPNLSLLKGKDLSNVTNMSHCFEACSNLKFDDNFVLSIPNIVNMSYMFQSCGGLTTVNIFTNNSTNVQSCYALFKSCRNLTDYNYDFSTDNCKSFGDMFSHCVSLNHIDTTKLNFTGVTSTINMFNNCINLTEIDLSNADLSSVTTAQNMFMNCLNLVDVHMENWNLTNITRCENMFRNCYNITNWDISNWNFGANLTNVANMFSYSSFDDVDGFGNRELSLIDNFMNVFTGCTSIAVANLSNISIPNVVNTYGLFLSCTNLTDLTISNINAPLMQYFQSIASSCGNLTNLKVEHINTNGTSVNGFYAFGNCQNLVNVDFNNADFRCWNVGSMFSYCNNLSNASIDSIINWILTANCGLTYKNMRPSNSYSPFYNTKFTNAYYPNRVAELQAAGWTV